MFNRLLLVTLLQLGTCMNPGFVFVVFLNQFIAFLTSIYIQVLQTVVKGEITLELKRMCSKRPRQNLTDEDKSMLQQLQDANQVNCILIRADNNMIT